MFEPELLMLFQDVLSVFFAFYLLHFIAGSGFWLAALAYSVRKFICPGQQHFAGCVVSGGSEMSTWIAVSTRDSKERG